MKRLLEYPVCTLVAREVTIFDETKGSRSPALALAVFSFVARRASAPLRTLQAPSLRKLTLPHGAKGRNEPRVQESIAGIYSPSAHAVDPAVAHLRVLAFFAWPPEWNQLTTN